MLADRVRKVDLVSEVVNRLQQRFIDGTLEGTLPSEAELCQIYGVSRTVIREALRVLQAQGVVELSQGRRPRVRPADPHAVAQSMSLHLGRLRTTLKDLIEVRKPLEGAIAAKAAERATDEQIDRMRQTIDTLRTAKKLPQRVDADLAFHRLLAEAANNPVFLMLLNTIWSLLQQSRYFTIPRSGVEVTASGHEAILNAVAAHKPGAARDAMLAHLDKAAAVIEDHMRV